MQVVVQILIMMMVPILGSSSVKAFIGPCKRATQIIITASQRYNYSFCGRTGSSSIWTYYHDDVCNFKDRTIRNHGLFVSSSSDHSDGKSLGDNKKVNQETKEEANDDDEETYFLELEVETPEEMEEVGAMLSMGTKSGDIIFLGGDLGAGKTCFSRGFVRARTGSIDLSVTSPTYLLSNVYPTQDEVNTIIHHMDLYRLTGNKDDFDPLDLENVFTDCISLIEWPSRLGELTPSERLEINITIPIDLINDSGNEESETRTRIMTLTPHGRKWRQKLLVLDEEGYLDDLIIE